MATDQETSVMANACEPSKAMASIDVKKNNQEMSSNQKKHIVYLDQDDIHSSGLDDECERLIRNTKRQVKQIMEEAVTRKFIHEDSSSIISLCVAVDACLSHGLKRRVLGLFKTSSSMALIHKAAKSCPTARQILDMIDQEETRMLEIKKSKLKSQQQRSSRDNNNIANGNPISTNVNESNSNTSKSNNISSAKTSLVRSLRNFQSSQQQQEQSNATSSLASLVHKRNLWIKLALMNNKLVEIIEFLAANASKYYEPDALMSNALGAQLVSSLLVGPSALEFSRSKINEYCYEEPTADELVRRHKLSNPIACLCHQGIDLGPATASMIPEKPKSVDPNSIGYSNNIINNNNNNNIPTLRKEPEMASSWPVRDYSLSSDCNNNNNNLPRHHGRYDRRRRPLSLKSNPRRSTLITTCHHLPCQDLSEHQQTRGYVLKSTSEVFNVDNVNDFNSNAPKPLEVDTKTASPGPPSSQSGRDHWPLWSPRILHEILHQTSRSHLLYAKNNVIMDAQGNRAIPGYLSLHQIGQELIIKWIPNQMINGSSSLNLGNNNNNSSKCVPSQLTSPIAVESSYLELVVSISVSRIVLLHCKFSRAEPERPSQSLDSEVTEETLILVEVNGIQRAPFRFPKGGLKLFLSCLQQGLGPNRLLDPAIDFDEAIWPSDRCNSPPIIGDSPSTDAPETPSSSFNPFDTILRRLPSLKRISGRMSPVTKNLEPQTPVSKALDSDLESVDTQTGRKSSCSSTNNLAATKNYVYRIVSAEIESAVNGNNSRSQQQPQSATVKASSLDQPKQSKLLDAEIDHNHSFPGPNMSNEAKFKWSLSRWTNFSSLYSGSSKSRTIASDDNECTMNNETDSMISFEIASGCGHNHNSTGDLSFRELARVEEKLHNLKKSTSDEVLQRFRDQSIQTLCESMRKQIIARAFYGWLVYCRRKRIIRKNLSHLILPDSVSSELDSTEEHPWARAGLTRNSWDELSMRREARESLSRIVNQLVYYGGCNDDNGLRKEVWPYLLEHYKFTDSDEIKMNTDKLAREAYESCGSQWTQIERVVKERDNEILAANIAKASKYRSMKAQKEEQQSTVGFHFDDRVANVDSQPDSIDSVRFQDTVDDGEASEGKDNVNDLEVDQRSAKRNVRIIRSRLESTGSVGSDASLTDQFGNNMHRIDKDVQRCDRNFWYFKDKDNLEKLRNVMCSYVWQHLDVGYVQGMCDLAAPFLVIFDDEVMAFNCFSKLMERMVSNFPQGTAMDKHFENLKYLMQVLDPKLFETLHSNGDYSYFYFCYRWLLLDFKRELAYEDVYMVWETIWSAREIITDNFVVFMALAMVRYYRDIIIENNMDFTDTIKFFNEMAEKHDAKKITALARNCVAELRYLINA